MSEPIIFGVIAALAWLAAGLVAGMRIGYHKGYDEASRALYAAYPEIGWPPRSKAPPPPPKMPPPLERGGFDVEWPGE